MILRRGSFGASLFQGVLVPSVPTPGTVQARLGVTSSPLGQSPRPLFAPGPLITDWAFPLVPPVPTVATMVDQALQPMQPGGGGAGAGGGDPNMPTGTMQGRPPVPSPPPRPPAFYDGSLLQSTPAGSGQSALSPDELAAIQAQNQALQDGNQQQQRMIWTTVLVGGAAVGAAVLLFRR